MKKLQKIKNNYSIFFEAITTTSAVLKAFEKLVCCGYCFLIEIFSFARLMQLLPQVRPLCYSPAEVLLTPRRLTALQTYLFKYP